MSRILTLTHGGRLLLAVGLTHAELDALKAGKSQLFDSEQMQTFAEGARPTGVMIIPGRDDEELLAQFAPFLPRREEEGTEEHRG